MEALLVLFNTNLYEDRIVAMSIKFPVSQESTSVDLKLINQQFRTKSTIYDESKELKCNGDLNFKFQDLSGKEVPISYKKMNDF